MLQVYFQVLLINLHVVLKLIRRVSLLVHSKFLMDIREAFTSRKTREFRISNANRMGEFMRLI